ncbi:MAG TPA: alpha-amylase family glycosyl hydrolase [Ohtaekwangia sp.]|nr:alpha-amylase family glycosyl hydrolase [Ohtaekwangia sp.]
MKKSLLIFFSFVIVGVASAQVVTTDPFFPKSDEQITITVDVTGTSLDNFAWNNETNPVWIWAWIEEGCTSNCDAPTNVNPATSAQNLAKATRVSTNPDKYQITFTPTVFFNRPSAELKKIGIKLKSRDWNDNKQSDNNRFIELDQQFTVSFASQLFEPIFVNQNDALTITAYASEVSDLRLLINGVEQVSIDNATMISHLHNVNEVAGTSLDIVVTANNGIQTEEASLNYIVRASIEDEPRPDNIIDGINYLADPSKVVLSLWAPDKTSVYVRGDFSDWKIKPEYQLKKDGEHFWIEISGLTPGEEYGFQYLVDESVWMADPYADKILDPDDQYIPESIYPDLKAFPEAARSDQWYFNRVAVFQTGQTPYEWQVTDFEKPDADELVIYELLIRDFFDEQNRSYQNLIDTLSYFKRLGINAIELMPIMEFNGNDSWGYNPTFMFAPDKAYGTKNAFKQFIDECHKQGIAVILDIAMNHHDTPNPYVLMDFDFAANNFNGKPKATNKWFNPDAKHPYNVFFDMNHESAYTKTYLDTVNHYWLNEYKIDGFRFDLTKGFTQNNRCSASTTDEHCIAQYDASRIAILKRMGSAIFSHTPDAYLILEHFGSDEEETELIDHGFMVWGNLNHAYSQNSKGFSGSSDIAGIYHKTRGLTTPGVVGYMESHDEERMMYRNLQEGNTSGSYTVKNLATALDRVEAASVVFYTIPGPKMLWQFGELGYDVSIDFNGRVGTKPVKWEYYDEPHRLALFNHTADLIRLRNAYDVFTDGDVTFTGNTTLLKQLTIKNTPYNSNPTTTDEMNVQIAVNFDVTSKSMAVSFPHTGTWYDYYNESQPINVTSSSTTVTLTPGAYKLYTDVPLHEVPPVTSTEESWKIRNQVFPNPTNGKFTIEMTGPLSISLLDSKGNMLSVKYEGNVFDISHLPSGLYLIMFRSSEGVMSTKRIVKY